MHVVRLESALWRTTSLLLVANEEAVAIDPGVSRAEVAAIEAGARACGAEVTHVLATHADWDHVCGIAAFPDAVAAMGQLSAAIVVSGAPAALIERRAEEHAISVAGAPRVDRVLEPGAAYQIGPFIVETLALAGHTSDGTAYRVRTLDLLAVGDHLSAVEFPFVTSTAAYRSSLAALIELLRHDPPGQIYPGHGPPLTVAEALAIAEADLAYLRNLRDEVAASLADSGTAADARAAGLTVALPREASPDLIGMHAGNVEAQLEELLPPRDAGA
jgi:glyoxylase-like metal-dependent hydrolase (beta-lactamase superfamily II)